MDRCNVTGETKGQLYDFHIKNDFNYNTRHGLEGENFSFVLSQSEYDKFMMKGLENLDENSKKHYTRQYEKWFSGEQIYDLISTFRYVPVGYFRDGNDTYTDEEEQLFWDNMDKSIRDLLSPERVKELSYFIGE